MSERQSMKDEYPCPVFDLPQSDRDRWDVWTLCEIVGKDCEVCWLNVEMQEQHDLDVMLGLYPPPDLEDEGIPF